MNKHSTIIDAIVIVCAACTIGIAWNYPLLIGVWKGEPTSASVGAPSQGTPLPIGLLQAKQMFDEKSAIFIDARSREDFIAGRIAGSRSIPLGEFVEMSDRLKKEVPLTSPLVVYCNGFGCPDSHNLAEKLVVEGYQAIYIYLGGYPEWQQEGYAIESGGPP